MRGHHWVYRRRLVTLWSVIIGSADATGFRTSAVVGYFTPIGFCLSAVTRSVSCLLAVEAFRLALCSTNGILGNSDKQEPLMNSSGPSIVSKH